MPTLFLYALLATSLYYLGSEAMITRPLWSRYPRRFGRFMRCAACTGFWYSLLAGLIGRLVDLPFFGIEHLPVSKWVAVPAYAFVVGLCGVVWTPLLAFLLVEALMRLQESEAEEGEVAAEGVAVPASADHPEAPSKDSRDA